MPRASDQVENNEFLLRVLAYGPAKARKTWWAATAAEAGFNVLLINGDDGTQVLKNLSPEALSRIRIIDCYDVFGNPRMAEFMTRFLKGGPVYWDDTVGKTVPVGVFKETSAHFLLEAKKLGPSDVLIVDSWTALADGVTLKLCNDMNVDLSDGNKLEWDLYGPAGRLLTWMLQQLVGLSCHCILIAHQDNYEKAKKDARGKLTAEIEFSRLQVKSSSRPHAMTIPKFFSDVLYFNMIGTNYYIDTAAHALRDGGCRGIPPKNWAWKELSFGELCRQAHAILKTAPVEDMPAAIYYPAGTPPTLHTTQSASNQPLATGRTETVVSPAQPSGLAALLNKQRGV